jgi:hypothetical protein
MFLLELEVGSGVSKWALWALVALLSTLGQAHALALRGPPAEMSIEDIPLGRASGAGLGSAPLGTIKVTNTGGEPIVVDMRLAAAVPGELKDGYEPATSLSWVKLAKPKLEIAPGGDGESPLLFALPKDRSLMGGQFQLQWVGEAKSRDGSKLGLHSQVLLNVARKDDDAIGQARRRIREKAPLDFPLSPPNGKVEGVPLGRKVDLRALGVRLKLVNPNAQVVTFAVFPTRESLGGETDGDGGSSEPGFSPGPNPNFLTLASPLVSVGPNGIGEAQIFLEIPDQKRYRGRSWIFDVRVELLEASEPAAHDFRLAVRTQGESM